MVYNKTKTMPKYLELKPHLSSTELEKRYRQSKQITERNHYHMIWLMSQGRRVYPACLARRMTDKAPTTRSMRR